MTVRPTLTLRPGTAVAAGSLIDTGPDTLIDYWDVRAETTRGRVHAGSIHQADGLLVPVCRAGHRLPGKGDVLAAVEALRRHIDRPSQPGDRPCIS